MKGFYSCPDTTIIRDTPQAIQHIVISNFAKYLGGEVTFYTMEDVFTVSSQEVILEKTKEKPDIDGIIFYRLAQFYFKRPPNLELMKTILNSGYGIYFARERISINGSKELDALFPLIYTAYYLEKRDAERTFFNFTYEKYLGLGSN